MTDDTLSIRQRFQEIEKNIKMPQPMLQLLESLPGSSLKPLVVRMHARRQSLLSVIFRDKAASVSRASLDEAGL
jgi:hypothetical protein